MNFKKRNSLGWSLRPTLWLGTHQSPPEDRYSWIISLHMQQARTDIPLILAASVSTALLSALDWLKCFATERAAATVANAWFVPDCTNDDNLSAHFS
mmetsp:Transcript_2858/g.4870  ORF Transcript_2858/g.4870 Transcript_2858/m.4870 type:complete len:97 (-) Transcript_2858:119-409(-)